MKRNSSLLAVFLAAACVVGCALQVNAEVLMDETFDGVSAVVGNDLSTLGWTNSFGQVLISSDVIDAGQCARNGGDWGKYTKDFSSRVLLPGETAVFTWSLKAFYAPNGTLNMGIQISGDLAFNYIFDTGQYIQQILNHQQVITDTTNSFTKFKIELTNSSSKFYRDEGAGYVLTMEGPAGLGTATAGAISFVSCGQIAFDNLRYVVLGPATSLTGTINLADYSAGLGNVAVVVDLAQSGVVTNTFKVFADDEGKITIPDAPVGAYDVTVKGTSSLRTSLGTVDIIGGLANDLGVVTLINGDIDGDNEVTSTDLSILGLNLGIAGD